jgi:phosphatidylglycerophosphatase A
MGVHDDGRIVFDEWAGQAISLLPIVAVHGEGFDAATFLWVLLSFGLFRFFDVIKPWPISWLDARVEGGLGIMIDDIVAGVFAALVLCAIMIGLGAIA